MVIRRLKRTGWRKLILLALVLALLAFNGIAWMQAWAMTHYASGGQRTPPIEALTFPEKVRAVATGVTIPRPQNTRTPKDVDLDYQTSHIPIPGREDEFLEAWYVPRSQPRGIVLVFPGYAESKDSLLAPAVVLHDMGYDLLMVDFRGAGGSSGDDTTLGIREGEDVATAFNYARSTWRGEPVVLYGVSMGAAAVLRAAAADGVKPSAIILESPFNRMADTVRNRFNAMGLPSFPAAELLVFWGGVQHGFNGFANNPDDYAESVTCPTLFLHGQDDPRVTTAQATEIYDRLSGHKEFVEFPGASHTLLISSDPQLWKSKVFTFLAQP